MFPVSRDDLVECAALLRSIRSGPARRHRPARRAARRAGAADRRRVRLPRLRGRRSLRAGDARVALSAPRARRLRRRAAHDGRRLCHPPRPPRARSCTATRSTRPFAAAVARGCSPRPRAARSRRSPTIASSSIRTTRSSARSTRTSRSRATRATSSSWATPRGSSCRSRAATSGSPMRRARRRRIPFWLGEAPARSDELSRAVSDLRAEVDRRLDNPASSHAGGPSTG